MGPPGIVGENIWWTLFWRHGGRRPPHTDGSERRCNSLKAVENYDSHRHELHLTTTERKSEQIAEEKKDQNAQNRSKQFLQLLSLN